jgi:hypothetical protein
MNQQIYSVWQPASRSYVYYAVNQPIDEDPKPRSVSSKLGASPSEISWRLPPGAKQVGSGALPKGVVVHPAESLLGFEDSVSLPLVAAVGLALWWVLK